jgi:hypothetical protein
VECPSCHRQAIQASEVIAVDEEGAWFICPDQACTQPPWRDTGRRGRPGERAPLVDQLVGLNAEELERQADWHRRRVR